MYLFKNNIGDEGAIAIAGYLTAANHLPFEIHLSHNNITEKGMLFGPFSQ